ncbi:NEW3 domain-containing protein [Lysobacter niabensis]|uniref:NEW3 domain-containing protein n=1 Tax=Agrilutibacter niabensis TaxID=380628 RepID=UPI003615880D
MPRVHVVLSSPSRPRYTRRIAAVLAVWLCVAAWQPACADTFYVRVDGGDASQCTGRNDAPYPGSGTGQACAWNHPFHALAPDGTRRIAGGDTLRIGSGSYMIGQGAPGAGNCLPANCWPANIPSGNGSATTRILGDPANPPKLWGTLGVARILSLDGSSNVEIGHLEITDQDDCVYSHSNAAVKCPAVGIGAWGKYGVYARASSNVWLHDLNIHGLGHSGLWAGGLTDWTLERVRLHRNGRAGWDANTGTGSSNSGVIILRGMEIAWNGCGERWQTGEAWACWGQQAGGYGDGFGTVATGGQWLIEDTFVHHNTQDGLDLRFLDGADGTHATLRRIHAMGNAGNQIKVKGNSLVENSVLIGNCGYFNGKFYMQAADNCRADGTTLLLVFTANDNVVVRHNSITGEGWSLIGATEGDSSGRALVQNNVLVGFPWFLGPTSLSRVQAGNSPAIVTHAGNLVWNVFANACPGDSVCGQDPALKDMALATFDAEPLPTSPVADRVAPLAEVTTDFLLHPRPLGAASDIGAYELPAGSTCVRAAPEMMLAGPAAAVPAGTRVDYALTLTNRDSAACAATGFSLADTAPAGWSSTLGTTTLTLEPGAAGSTTLSVTSAVDAIGGDYSVSAGAGSSAGGVHAASATTIYTVQASAPVCTPAAPTLSLGGPTAAVPAGTAIEYTVGLLNNDSSACTTTSFSLAESVPVGWTGTLAVSSLALAPGASGSTTLTVASAPDAEPGAHGIGAGASSEAGSVHTVSTGATYTVAAPPPPCTRAAPTLDLSGPTAAVPAGTTVDYTFSVINNDSGTCTSTSFSLAGSVPPGWTGALTSSSLTLAPGASGSTTLAVTSASDATTGGYTIGAGVSSSAGGVHTSSASATYTVDVSPLPCTRAAPTLGLSGPTAAVPAGTAVDYTVSVSNNDSSTCASSSFSLARSVPAGWTGTLASSSLTLAPGSSGSTTLAVTSASDATAGGYTIGAGVGSSAGAVHTSNASATYTVDVPPPVCTRAAPTLNVSGPAAAVPADTAIDYTVSISNNDSATCASTSFSLTRSVPAGWTGTLASSSLTLAPGANGNTTLTVTSASDAVAGGYTVGAGVGSSAGAVHTANASATYIVDVPPPVCTRAAPTLNVSGPTAAVPAGTAVDYTVSVSNNDTAACASTSFSLTRSVPAGWTGTLAASSLTLAPGANGNTTLTVASASDAVAGGYTVGAGVGSSAGAVHTANASATYTVDVPPPMCTRAAPTLNVSGPTAAVPAGTAVDYTVSVSNNDTATCTSTSFSLTRSVPAGWTGTLASSSLTLAPGANGSTTLAVTSASDATAGGYTIAAGVSSSAGAVHTASASASYTVAVPPPVCTRAAPIVSLSGPTTAVAAGTAVAYTLSVSNQDSNACATTSFDLASSVPAGWSGTLAASSLSLAPGANGNTTLTVTSAGTAASGAYTVGATVGSSADSVHAGSATATYTVAPPPPVCTRAAPTLGLSGPTTAVAAGTAVDYTVSLVNRDSAACASTSFNLASSVPSGWTGTLTATSLSLAAGGSGSTTLRVTSASNAAAGSYSVSVGTSSSVGAVHTSNATGSYTVAPPAINLTTTLTTDRATYARRATVQIAALLRDNGAPLASIPVTFTLARPGGGTNTLTATSGSDGYARTTYKVPNTKAALGQYTVTARWSFGGVNASAVTTFTVL